jgi:hypothetical protein
MGSSWSGFLPQNDVVRLQWAVLEASQNEAAATALSFFMGAAPQDANESGSDAEEECWQARELEFRPVKV